MSQAEILAGISAGVAARADGDARDSDAMQQIHEARITAASGGFPPRPGMASLVSRQEHRLVDTTDRD
ncbi:MAG: hypothetical protein JXA90_06090 [Planctomycetes bacterium]|nr:hypothetical protein [Planctomycetota bacterium]